MLVQRAPEHGTTRVDLELRRQFDLGARKIQRSLCEEFDTVPCVDTIHNVLKRQGCVEP